MCRVCRVTTETFPSKLSIVYMDCMLLQDLALNSLSNASYVYNSLFISEILDGRTVHVGLRSAQFCTVPHAQFCTVPTEHVAILITRIFGIALKWFSSVCKVA